VRDAGAYDDFYRSTSQRLLRYCYAWRHWRAVAGHPAPEAWLRLTASRLATDRYRRLAGLRRAVARTGPAAPAEPPSDDVLVVTQALRRIPADQRRALAMHYLLDLPVSEIALELDVPIGTVKSWLSRGRAAMAAQLSSPDDPSEATRGA
jgi:RNA polymerase sigma-70 factor (ECF subfamily)